MKTKTLLLAFPLLLGLAACSNDKGDEPTESKENQITFAATAGSSITRAEIGTLLNQQTTANLQNFQVWAYTAETDAAFMEGVDVTRAGSGWTYSPVQYWPIYTLNFYALYPEGLEPTFGNYAKSTTATMAFKLSNTGLVDVLYAVAADQQKSATAQQVDLNFRHALAQMQFNFSVAESMSKSVKVLVKQVTVDNLDTEATFTLPNETTAPLGTDVENPAYATISGLSAPKIVTVANNAAGKALTTVPTDLNTTGYYYFVPQKLTSKSQISVTLQVLDEQSGLQVWPETAGYGTVTYQLSSNALTALQQGHRYVFNIEVSTLSGMQPVEFNVTVDEYNINNTINLVPAD